MNNVTLMGRLTRDPEIKENVTSYTIAVDRRFKKDGEPTADFIRCVAFGKAAEFAAKWFTKGTSVAVSGRIQTGSYTNKDGAKVYTTDVIVEQQEFAGSRKENAMAQPKAETPEDDWMRIADGIQEELPFA